MIWAFVLQPTDARTTRLLVRASGEWERRSVGLMLYLFWRPMHFAMQRKQLLTLSAGESRHDQSVEGQLGNSVHRPALPKLMS